MGQYHYIVNLDKKEYLHPHRYGDGLKLMEFGCSRDGTLAALTVLLAAQNGRGGGDIRSDDPLVGSWAGDRIAIIGDYAAPIDPVGWDDENNQPLYVTADADDEWRELSEPLHALFAAANERFGSRNR